MGYILPGIKVTHLALLLNIEEKYKKLNLSIKKLMFFNRVVEGCHFHRKGEFICGDNEIRNFGHVSELISSLWNLT